MATIDSSDLQALIDLAEKLDREITEAIAAAAKQGRSAIQAITPAPPTPAGQKYQRTGHLRKSWRGYHSKRSLKLRNTAYYADYVESGTSKMPARPMLDPVGTAIENELARALATGTGFDLPGSRYQDPVDALRQQYQQKYGNYGSHKAYRG